MITETIPEIILKLLKFESEYKDLLYHEEDKKYAGRCLNPQLNQDKIDELQK